MTDERSSDPELVLRAEGLVAKLSSQEPDWEALALRVSARLGDAKLDESLLAPPLPEADGESELDRLIVAKPAASQPGSGREAVSLAELARASVARRGVRDAASIAKESLAVASQTRGQAERTAERGHAGPARAQAAPASPAPSSRRSRAPLGDTRGPWIGVAIAAVGLAAGFGLYIAGQRRAPEVVGAAVPNAALVPEVAKAEARAALPEAKPLDLGAVQPAPGVEELAAPMAAAAPVAESAPPAEAPAGHAQPPAKASAPSRPEATKVKAARVVLDDEPSPQGTKPAESSPLRPAELAPQGGTTDRPSAGAAQAAVGAVLGAARACLAGQTAPSSATLIFGSSGEVERVNVAGPAAGTPAAGCVESALKKARVQPFAAQSFSLGVTVRPP